MPGSRITERSSFGQFSATRSWFSSRTSRSAVAEKYSGSSDSQPRVFPRRADLYLRAWTSPSLSTPITWKDGNTSIMVFSISLPSESRNTIWRLTKSRAATRCATPGWFSLASIIRRNSSLSVSGTVKGSIRFGLVKEAWIASFSARRTGKSTRSAAVRALSSAFPKIAAVSSRLDAAEKPHAP